MALEGPDVRMRVLIENKIDAALQHRQADRYKERCKQYVDASGCDIAITVLLAPRRYLEAREMIGGFDCQLTYESALDWLERNDPDNPYSAYSLELLRKATDRAKVGWTFQPNTAATNHTTAKSTTKNDLFVTVSKSLLPISNNRDIRAILLVA